MHIEAIVDSMLMNGAVKPRYDVVVILLGRAFSPFETSKLFHLRKIEADQVSKAEETAAGPGH